MRELSKKEKSEFLANRNFMLEELNELQADFEDMSDEQLILCRDCMRERVNRLLNLCLETDEEYLA